MFTEVRIVLISNVPQKTIQGVTLKIYEESLDSKELNQNITHPKNFRTNFWHTSIARFTYLLQYQRESQVPLLHVESDVILSKDFPLSKIFSNTKIAYPILSQFRGVASVFFTPNTAELSKFVNFIVNESKNDSKITDMIALRRYFDHNTHEVEILPAGPVDLDCYHPEIVSDIHPELKAGLEKYSGVFDGSDIGMYLFGTDPRNRVGWQILRQEVDSTYTKLRNMKFIYDDSREFLNIRNDGEWIPVFNLHMTSKEIKLFELRNVRKNFERFLIHDCEHKRFIPIIYAQMAIGKLRRIIFQRNR